MGMEDVKKKEGSKEVPFRLKMAGLFLLGFFLCLVIKGRAFFMEILTPCLLSVILAYLLMPLWDKLKQWGVKENYLVYIVMFFFFSLLILLIFLVIPRLTAELKSLLDTISDYSVQIDSLLQDFKHLPKNKESQEMILAVLEQVKTYVTGTATRFLKWLMDSFMNAVSKFTTIFIVPILTFYFLRDKGKIKRGFLKLLPVSWEKDAAQLLQKMDESMIRFIKGQLWVSLMIGIGTFGILYFLGIRYAPVFAVFNGILNIIPYFGPILGAVPILLFVLVSSPSKAGLTLLLLWILQQVESSVISPKIMGNSTGLHPAVIVLAIFAGEKLFGISGMFLAIPILSLLKVVCQFVFAKILEIQ